MMLRLRIKRFLGEMGLVVGIVCAIFFRLEPVGKFQLSSEPPLVEGIPAGEIISNFRLVQLVEVNRPVDLAAHVNSEVVCLEIMLASYGSRRNKGVMAVDLALDGNIFTQEVDVAKVRDNTNHRICFSRLMVGILFNAKQVTLTLRGLSSLPGTAVTAWTTTDLSAGTLLNVPAPLVGRSLVFRFVTQGETGDIPASVWILLLLGLVAAGTVFLPSPWVVKRQF